jgi:hypothetical protein
VQQDLPEKKMSWFLTQLKLKRIWHCMG